MTQPEDLIRLRHMLDHAREAVDLIQGKERWDLDQERTLELALVRLVEIVGEAASRISADTQAGNPSIPWPHIVGMRNRLMHGYETVDLNVLWDTLVDDLPPLIAELQTILANELRGPDSTNS